jgi:hypothetical protein
MYFITILKTKTNLLFYSLGTNISLFFFVWKLSFELRALCLARQVCYHLSHTPVLKYIFLI